MPIWSKACKIEATVAFAKIAVRSLSKNRSLDPRYIVPINAAASGGTSTVTNCEKPRRTFANASSAEQPSTPIPVKSENTAPISATSQPVTATKETEKIDQRGALRSTVQFLCRPVGNRFALYGWLNHKNRVPPDQENVYQALRPAREA